MPSDMDYGVRYWMSEQLMEAVAHPKKPFDGDCLVDVFRSLDD